MAHCDQKYASQRRQSLELLEGKVIVSRARSPSRQSGTSAKAPTCRCAFRPTNCHLLACRSCAPLPRSQAEVDGCLLWHQESQWTRERQQRCDEPERFWAQLGFSFSGLGQCFLFPHKNTLRALVPGTVPGTEAHLSLNQGHWPKSPKPQSHEPPSADDPCRQVPRTLFAKPSFFPKLDVPSRC